MVDSITTTNVTVTDWTIINASDGTADGNTSLGSTPTQAANRTSIDLSSNTKTFVIFSNWNKDVKTKFTNLNGNSYLSNNTLANNRIELKNIDTSAAIGDATMTLGSVTFGAADVVDFDAKYSSFVGTDVVSLLQFSSTDVTDVIAGDISGNLELLISSTETNTEFGNFDLHLHKTETDSIDLSYNLTLMNSGGQKVEGGSSTSEISSDPHKFELVDVATDPSGTVTDIEIANTNITFNLVSSHEFGNQVTVKAYADNANTTALDAWVVDATTTTTSKTFDLRTSKTESANLILNDLFDSSGTKYVEFRVTIQQSMDSNDKVHNSSRANHLETAGGAEVCILRLYRVESNVVSCDVLNLGNGWKIYVNPSPSVSELVTTRNGIIQSRIAYDGSGVE